MILVRHGESTWNASGLLQGGAAAVGLTERGRAQARAAARELTGETGPTRILTSPQDRAAQTAQILAEVLGLPVEQRSELREQGHGVWEGRPAAVYAPLLAAAGPDWAPPGGETFHEVCERVRGTGLADAVVVSHGETIRALLAVALGCVPAGIPGNGEVVRAACFSGVGVMSFG